MKKRVAIIALLGASFGLAAASQARGKNSARHASARHAPARHAAPNGVEARRQMAIEYVKRAADAYARHDYRTVIALCKTASNWAPTYARAYAWSGAAYQKLGNYSEARFAYRWVVALAPGTPDAARAQRGLREVGG